MRRDRPAPHEAVDTVFLDPEVVLFDGRDASVVRLNPSASAVWLLLDGATPPRAIAAELAEIVGLPTDVLADDVDAAVAEFAAQGLLAGTSRLTDEEDVPEVEDLGGPYVLLDHPTLEATRRAAPCGRGRSTSRSTTGSSAWSTTPPKPWRSSRRTVGAG